MTNASKDYSRVTAQYDRLWTGPSPAPAGYCSECGVWTCRDDRTCCEDCTGPAAHYTTGSSDLDSYSDLVARMDALVEDWRACEPYRARNPVHVDAMLVCAELLARAIRPDPESKEVED